MNYNFFLSLAVLLGAIVGAGIFGIPYLISTAGVLPCLFYFLILTFTVVLLHLLFGEIVLRTAGQHRLVFYAGKYLNKKASGLAAFSVIVGTTGSLLAYLILGGRFASLVFPFFSAFQWSILFWAGLSFLVFLGIKTISSVEFWLNLALIAVFLIIFGFSIPRAEAANFNWWGNDAFLPFGVILFSLIGFSAIPEAASILKQKKDLKKIIIIATTLSALLAFILGVVVSGVSGTATSQDGFEGLKLFLGRPIIILGGIFGLLAVSTSFLVLASYLKSTFCFDWRVPSRLAFLLSVLPSILLFLAGLRSFIAVIGSAGTIMALIEGGLIIFIYQKSRAEGSERPAYCLRIGRPVLFFLLFVLAAGALLQIVQIIT